METFFVLPRDLLEDHPLDLADTIPGSRISIDSVLKMPFGASGIALSYESATEPTDTEPFPT